MVRPMGVAETGRIVVWLFNYRLSSVALAGGAAVAVPINLLDDRRGVMAASARTRMACGTRLRRR